MVLGWFSQFLSVCVVFFALTILVVAGLVGFFFEILFVVLVFGWFSEFLLLFWLLVFAWFGGLVSF